MTAAARDSRTIVRAGTEEWLRRGPNQRMARHRRATCRQIRSPNPKLSPLHGTGASPPIPSGANLSWANLNGADLSEAILAAANLSGALLSGTNLSEAKFFETIVLNTDLGLVGPSGNKRFTSRLVRPAVIAGEGHPSSSFL